MPVQGGIVWRPVRLSAYVLWVAGHRMVGGQKEGVPLERSNALSEFHWEQLGLLKNY